MDKTKLAAFVALHFAKHEEKARNSNPWIYYCKCHNATSCHCNTCLLTDLVKDCEHVPADVKMCAHLFLQYKVSAHNKRPLPLGTAALVLNHRLMESI